MTIGQQLTRAADVARADICDSIEHHLTTDGSRSTEQVFLSSGELADRWRCSPKTLRNKRCKGEGLAWVNIGGLVRYRLSDVLNYEADQIRRTRKVETGR